MSSWPKHHLNMHLVYAIGPCTIKTQPKSVHIHERLIPHSNYSHSIVSTYASKRNEALRSCSVATTSHYSVSVLFGLYACRQPMPGLVCARGSLVCAQAERATALLTRSLFAVAVCRLWVIYYFFSVSILLFALITIFYFLSLSLV
ncbi:hypothetical protein OURE66S_01803 [Oligella ureolytica]